MSHKIWKFSAANRKSKWEKETSSSFTSIIWRFIYNVPHTPWFTIILYVESWNKTVDFRILKK